MHDYEIIFEDLVSQLKEAGFEINQKCSRRMQYQSNSNCMGRVQGESKPSLSRGMSMTIKEEIFDQIEELNCSLRELTDYELVDCRQALINRTNILMGLMEELCDSQITVTHFPQQHENYTIIRVIKQTT